MASKKRREDRSSTAAGFESPFAGLAKLKEQLPPGEAPAPEVAVEEPPALRGKIVVRRERKGRGGKTVTVVEGLGLEGEALAELAREMKRALGCGAGVEGDQVVLQGAHEERARAFLEERGAARVVVGTRS